MKILFGVCSEGNGHLTQAISIKQLLKDNYDYDISCALVAKKNKGLAKYFTEQFKVIQFDGFDFVFDNNGKVIVWKSILQNTLELPRLIVSFIKICNIIKKEKPDVIFNYYEPLVGLTALFFKNIKYISVGHQYAMETSVYPKINGYHIQKQFVSIINKVTTINAKVVALSFYEFEDNNVIPCPPILRKESYIKSNKQEDFILVYLMNEDMLPDLIKQSIQHPNLVIQCFTKLTKQFDCPPNLTVYNLDGKLFQEKMKVCKSVICSGGFETASEAILNKKPLLMIPMPNHYEQHCNVNDAKLHGYAEWCENIDLSKIPNNQRGNDVWFNKVNTVINELLK